MSETTRTFPRHYEDRILLNASLEDVFAFIDDHANLSSHMNKSSPMTGGGRMTTAVDGGYAREVGSHIRLSGRVLGILLYLDEVVTRREPPRLKVWETVGDIRLLVVGHYRMGIEVTPRDGKSCLRVFIDYALPGSNAWLGRLLGGTYARWCVRQMLQTAAAHFAG